MATANYADILSTADTDFVRSHDFRLQDTTVALIQTGSHAYGTSTPTSDEDFTAIVVPPTRYLLGLGRFEHWHPGPDGTFDVKAMSLTKFVNLALDGNPNVVEMLFFEPAQLLYASPEFFRFIEIRNAFLSREVYKRFSGYASNQMQKMTSGRYEQEMGAKRKAWVDKIGYDPKDASHLVRLLLKGSELARLGTLTPRLQGGEAQLVRDIKNGEWALHDVKRYAGELGAVNEAWFQDPKCPLPVAPDRTRAERLLIEAHRKALVDEELQVKDLTL